MSLVLRSADVATFLKARAMAGQLGFGFERKPVQAPGSHGGHGYWEGGEWHYGDRPEPSGGKSTGSSDFPPEDDITRRARAIAATANPATPDEPPAFGEPGRDTWLLDRAALRVATVLASLDAVHADHSTPEERVSKLGKKWQVRALGSETTFPVLYETRRAAIEQATRNGDVTREMRPQHLADAVASYEADLQYAPAPPVVEPPPTPAVEPGPFERHPLVQQLRERVRQETEKGEGERRIAAFQRMADELAAGTPLSESAMPMVPPAGTRLYWHGTTRDGEILPPVGLVEVTGENQDFTGRFVRVRPLAHLAADTYFDSRTSHNRNADGTVTVNAADWRHLSLAPDDAAPSQEPAPGDPQRAAKLRQLADAMQPTIDAKRDPAIGQQNITLRRSRIASGMLQDADRLDRIQATLRALADHAEQGTTPPSLAAVATRADVEDVLRRRELPTRSIHREHLQDIAELVERPDMANEPLTAERAALAGILPRVPPDKDHWRIPVSAAEGTALKKLVGRIRAVKPKNEYGHTSFMQYDWVLSDIHGGDRAERLGLTTPEQWTEARAALTALGDPSAPSAEVQRARTVKDLERGLIGIEIPGYFPTPRALAEEAVAAAHIGPGMTVLEPSAGKGDLADAIRAAAPDAVIETIEPSSALRAVLEARGHQLVGRDIFEHAGQYDRIVMNAPYENGQDIDHTRHAYEKLLKPGGRLVSIMSEGPWGRQDRKATAFRGWLDDLDSSAEKNPEGSFRRHESSDRTTGVATRLVIIDKPEAPATLSVPERSEGDAEDHRPIAKAMRLAVDGDEAFGSPVARLFFGRRPAAVLGRVRAVVVGALHRVSGGRTESHVGDEVSKAAPAVANRNAAATIDRPFFVTRIRAALNHGVPRRVFGASGQSVRTTQGADAITPGASAARGVAVPQPERRDLPFVSAVAAALPERTSAGTPDGARAGVREGDHATKSYPGKVEDRSRHQEIPARSSGLFKAKPPARAELATVSGLASRKAAIEKDLLYLDEEDLPALDDQDDADAIVAKAILLQRRGALLNDLRHVERRLGPLLKARELHGRRAIDGVNVSIENRAGSVRHWTDHDGTEGATTMRHAYGYVRGTVGVDGDHLDAFLGPLARTGQVEGTTVYVVTTRKPPDFRELDEQKAMVGWPDLASARAAFVEHYGGEARFIQQIDALPWADFKEEAAATAIGGGLVGGQVVERAGATALLKAVSEYPLAPSKKNPAVQRHQRPAYAKNRAEVFAADAARRIREAAGLPAHVTPELAGIMANYDPADDHVRAMTQHLTKCHACRRNLERVQAGGAPEEACPVAEGIVDRWQRASLQKARLVLKAHVKAFTRTTKSGETVQVAEHDDRRAAARPTMPHPRGPAAAKPMAGRLRFTAPRVPFPKGIAARKPEKQPEQPKPITASQIPHEELAQHVASFRPILHKTLDALAETFPGVDVAGRLKETASLGEKLQRKAKSLDEIEDLCGTRITFGSIHEQLAAVERLKRRFTVRSEDDYLTRPKDGMNYRSYHLILEVDGKPVELQLRTKRQTAWADYAHDTAYKSHGKTPPAELTPYLKAMSDFYACRDGGEATCGDPPPCPPPVAKEVGRCLEAA